MFKQFKKKSKIKKLEKEYRRLLEESYQLSTQNRKLSDQKSEEANMILDEIYSLKRIS